MLRTAFILILLALLSPAMTYAHPGHDHNLFAQNNTLQVASEPAAMDDASESGSLEEERIIYDLPYPGMLPDNPLYVLKTVRDAIVKFLISDPVKKSEFNLLTSDKRLHASILLLEKDKPEKAVESLIKSNDYLFESEVSLRKAEAGGLDAKGTRDRISTAVKKHIQVVSQQIAPQVRDGYGDVVEKELSRLEAIEQSVTGQSSEE